MRQFACFVLACILASPAQAVGCPKEPTIEFVEEPYEPGSGLKVETVVVDGKKWSNRYLKSALLGIPGYDVMPDCRVLIIGRKGLNFHVTIDDVEWKNHVYNSTFFTVSKDGSKVLQADRHGTIILNDVVQPSLTGTLEDIYFDGDGNVITKWAIDEKEVHAVNGRIVQK